MFGYNVCVICRCGGMADALASGASGKPCGFKSHHLYQKKNCALCSVFFVKKHSLCACFSSLRGQTKMTQRSFCRDFFNLIKGLERASACEAREARSPGVIAKRFKSHHLYQKKIVGLATSFFQKLSFYDRNFFLRGQTKMTQRSFCHDFFNLIKGLERASACLNGNKKTGAQLQFSFFN